MSQSIGIVTRTKNNKQTKNWQKIPTKLDIDLAQVIKSTQREKEKTHDRNEKRIYGEWVILFLSRVFWMRVHQVFFPLR